MAKRENCNCSECRGNREVIVYKCEPERSTGERIVTQVAEKAAVAAVSMLVTSVLFGTPIDLS